MVFWNMKFKNVNIVEFQLKDLNKQEKQKQYLNFVPKTRVLRQIIVNEKNINYEYTLDLSWPANTDLEKFISMIVARNENPLEYSFTLLLNEKKWQIISLGFKKTIPQNIVIAQRDSNKIIPNIPQNIQQSIQQKQPDFDMSSHQIKKNDSLIMSEGEKWVLENINRMQSKVNEDGFIELFINNLPKMNEIPNIERIKQFYLNHYV